LGRICNAVRDNPERVEFIGYDPHVVRYLAYMFAGFFAGIAGGLAAINFEIANSAYLGATQSGLVLFSAFIGGTAYFFGPILGAILVTYLQLGLTSVTSVWQLYFGIIFIGIVMFAPGGLAAASVAPAVAAGPAHRGAAPPISSHPPTPPPATEPGPPPPSPPLPPPGAPPTAGGKLTGAALQAAWKARRAAATAAGYGCSVSASGGTATTRSTTSGSLFPSARSDTAGYRMASLLPGASSANTPSMRVGPPPPLPPPGVGEGLAPGVVAARGECESPKSASRKPTLVGGGTSKCATAASEKPPPAPG
jgi:hypothetical protein